MFFCLLVGHVLVYLINETDHISVISWPELTLSAYYMHILWAFCAHHMLILCVLCTLFVQREDVYFKSFSWELELCNSIHLQGGKRFSLEGGLDINRWQDESSSKEKVGNIKFSYYHLGIQLYLIYNYTLYYKWEYQCFLFYHGCCIDT